MQQPHGHLYDEAVILLDRAAELEPNYVPILGLAATAHLKRRGRGQSPPGVDDVTIGHALAHRAIEADPNDPSVLMVHAGMTYRDGDGDGDGDGELAPALALARRACELNPNSPIICVSTGWFEWVGGNNDAPIACALRALELSLGVPERFWALSSLARIIWRQGAWKRRWYGHCGRRWPVSWRSTRRSRSRA